MRKDRYYLYKDKISHINTRITNLIDWKDKNWGTDLVKLAGYKAIQEIAEGIMNILAMIIKDINLKSKDDYSNIEICKKNNIITRMDVLYQLNGLRNRIVHSYNGIIDKIAYNSIYQLLSPIEGIIQEINLWLDNLLTD